MKRLAGLLAALCMLSGIAFGAGSAAAQTYPAQPIRLLVGYPPGSASDFIARLIAPKMTEGLGQPVVVENRAGAAGILAATAAAKAPPDGYTILMTVPGSITTARALLGSSLQYSPETDLVPIGLIGVTPLLLLVTKESGIKTMAELVTLAKSTPGGINIASYGVGAPSHFAIEMLKVNTKLPITHVPHTGSAAMMTALMGGIVPAAFDSVTSAMPQVRSGRVVALGLTASARLAALPDVPTMAEAGMGPVEVGGWAGLHAPKGTSPDIVRRLNAELNRVIALPDVREKMGDRLILGGGSTASFETFIQNERARLTKVIEDAQLKFE